jgi:hypothetical protein
MEDRVKINGVWYVRETKITKEELDIIDFIGCVYENDKYCWEATVLYKDDNKTLYDSIDIKFTDKRTKPFKEDNWDNNTWLLGVLKNDQDSMVDAREAMDEDGIETFQVFLEYLKGKQWL